MAEFEPFTVALIMLIAFGTAVLHSAGGFAGGLLLAIFLAPVLGVKETVPVATMAMLVSNVARVWVFRRAINWRPVAAIFCAALPGITFGALLYVHLSVHAVAGVLGAFLVIAVLLGRIIDWRTRRIGLRGLSMIGVPFGLVSGTTFGGGMMLIPFLLGAGIVGEQLIAVAAALGLGLNLTKTVIFGLSPLLTASLAVKGVLIGLFMIPGAYTGRWIVTNTPVRIHTALMEVFLLCGAIYFLCMAAEGFGWL